jgi:hypothetical protein
MGRVITKTSDGKFRIEDSNEVLVERKTLEDAVTNMEKQKVALEENLKAVNDELKRLKEVL